MELDRLLRAAEGVEGCVLLSTCNRTELYSLLRLRAELGARGRCCARQRGCAYAPSPGPSSPARGRRLPGT
ncbi:MAG: hypothetical protein ACLRWQ_20305 [Flavonifractor plautii]